MTPPNSQLSFAESVKMGSSASIHFGTEVITHGSNVMGVQGPEENIGTPEAAAVAALQAALTTGLLMD
jgi:hypothetical protein